MKKAKIILLIFLVINILLLIINSVFYQQNQNLNDRYNSIDTISILKKLLRDQELINLTLDTNKRLDINEYPYLLNLINLEDKLPYWIAFYFSPNIGREYHRIDAKDNHMLVYKFEIRNDTAKVEFMINKYLGFSILSQNDNKWKLNRSVFQKEFP